MQQEGAAADAAGLRLDQRQHHLHRNGGVERAAAGLEHLVARVGGQRVGRGHGKLLRCPARLVGTRLPRHPCLQAEQGATRE
jgi:hypothetical protein